MKNEIEAYRISSKKIKKICNYLKQMLIYFLNRPELDLLVTLRHRLRQ